MFCKEILVQGRIRLEPDYRGGVGAAGTSETSTCINRCLGAPGPPAAVVSHTVTSSVIARPAEAREQRDEGHGPRAQPADVGDAGAVERGTGGQVFRCWGRRDGGHTASGMGDRGGRTLRVLRLRPASARSEAGSPRPRHPQDLLSDDCFYRKCDCHSLRYRLWDSRGEEGVAPANHTGCVVCQLTVCSARPLVSRWVSGPIIEYQVQGDVGFGIWFRFLCKLNSRT